MINMSQLLTKDYIYMEYAITKQLSINFELALMIPLFVEIDRPIQLVLNT